MSVLVTGGAGYIGGHMVLGLLDRGEDVVVLDNLSTGFDWAVPKSAKLIVGDIGDIGLVDRILSRHNIDAIAHFAAKIIVPESVADPLGYYLNNTAGARSLLECAVRAKVRHFIFSSTAAVYGEPAVNPIHEDAPLSPINPYGRSKLMVEGMLQDTAKAHDLHFAILRYFNVAGADPRGRYGQSGSIATHLIKVAVQAVLGRRAALEVYGTDYPTPDGSCIRDYVQVTDLVAAHLLALDHLRKGGENLTCNCGYGRGLSVLEVIEAVKKVSGIDFEVRLCGRRAGDPVALVAGAERIKTILGWKPEHVEVEKMVRQALDWESQLQDRTRAAELLGSPSPAQ